MQKVIFTVSVFLISLFINAQDFQGIAVYESKTSFHDLETFIQDAEEDHLFKENLSKAMEKQFTLRFDKTTSIYEEEEKLAAPTGGGGGMAINFSEGGNYYRNLKTKKFTQENDIFDKEFLIVDSLRKWEWKLENVTKKIGNYTCYKATCIIKPEPVAGNSGNDDKSVMITDMVTAKETIITAWYTPEIPVSHGPGEYWGLPGLILEANDGHTTLLCSKLTLNTKEKLTIKAPVKGTKVTRAEFNSIMEKKMQEMENMPNSGIIKVGG